MIHRQYLNQISAKLYVYNTYFIYMHSTTNNFLFKNSIVIHCLSYDIFNTITHFKNNILKKYMSL